MVGKNQDGKIDESAPVMFFSTLVPLYIVGDDFAASEVKALQGLKNPPSKSNTPVAGAPKKEATKKAHPVLTKSGKTGVPSTVLSEEHISKVFAALASGFAGYGCAGCKGPVEYGAPIAYWQEAHEYIVWHQECWEDLGNPKKRELTEEEKSIPLVDPLKEVTYRYMPPVKHRELNWLTYLGVGASALPLSLTRQAADFYLLEFSASVRGVATKEYEAYSLWLAELYAKYMLAASLGELRHRPEALKVSPLITTRRGGTRQSSHHRASRIWALGPDTVVKASEDLAKSFRDPSWERGGVGGSRWATIAEVVGYYIQGRFPPGVFVDTAYNVVHNGGTLFDKGRAGENQSLSGHPLFSVDADLRMMLVEKSRRGIGVLLPHASASVLSVYKGSKVPRALRSLVASMRGR